MLQPISLLLRLARRRELDTLYVTHGLTCLKLCSRNMCIYKQVVAMHIQNNTWKSILKMHRVPVSQRHISMHAE